MACSRLNGAPALMMTRGVVLGHLAVIDQRANLEFQGGGGFHRELTSEEDSSPMGAIWQPFIYPASSRSLAYAIAHSHNAHMPQTADRKLRCSRHTRGAIPRNARVFVCVLSLRANNNLKNGHSLKKHYSLLHQSSSSN